MLPDKITPAFGEYPSRLVPSGVAVKLYKLVKPAPSVLMANTAPTFSLPPEATVPYKMLLDKVKTEYGRAPSLKVKLCRFVKPVPLVLMANTVPASAAPPVIAVPYRVVSPKINPASG